MTLSHDTSQPLLRADIDKNFSPYEVQKLAVYNLPPLSDVIKAVINKTLDWRDYNRKLSKQIQALGQKKGQLSKRRKSKDKNRGEIYELLKDIKLLQKYRTHLQLLDEGKSLISPTTTGTTGKGVRRYKLKRNAYKIGANNQYGGLMINVP